MRHDSQSARNEDSKTAQTAIQTAGEAFDDGVILELISCPSSVFQLSLLRWDGQTSTAAERIDHAGKIYRPIRLSPGLLRALRFPSEPVDYGSTADLFGRIVAVLARFHSLGGRDSRLLAAWILSCCFGDVLCPVPSVLLSGSAPDAGSLLRLLHCLTRRGLTLAELTSAAFLRLPMEIHPTLLIEQTRLSRGITGLLRASSNRGSYIASGGDLLDVSCPKAIYSVMNDLDPAIAQNLLRISVPPAGSRSAILDAQAAKLVATEFQPLLLCYRLRNLRRVRESSVDAPELTRPVRELARALGTSLGDDPNLAAEIISLLADQDGQLGADRCVKLEYGIIVTVSSLVHEREKREMLVREIAVGVNAALRTNGEIREYSPEEVGQRLAALGLFTSRIPGGRGLRFTREVSRRVHYLQRLYGITIAPDGFPGCPDCEPPFQVPDPKRLE